MKSRRSSEPGLFLKHLRGDYSLARSYWVHTVMLGWSLAFIGVFALDAIGERYAIRHLSMAVLAFEAGLILAWVWSLVGTWMSALKHLFGGGSKFWAIVTLLMLAVGAFATIKEVSTMGQFLREHWETAKGRQPTDGFAIQLVDGGRVVDFTGGINEGAASALDKIVADAAKVTIVRLDSPGGWLREGGRMAEVVRRYGLSTRVENECFSSCTLVLLAGLDRTTGPDALVGFHRGRPIGQSKRPTEPASDEEAAYYLRAGLSKALVQRILSTPNDDMWIPTRRELLKAEVLTR